MKRCLRVQTVMAVLLLACLFVYETALAQLPLGTPTANREVGSLMPFDLVQKIALKKAQERWGQVAPGPYLALCDDDGDLVAYMFPFAIGAQSFPAYSEIKSAVKEGRKIAEKGLEAMTKADRQRVLNEVEKDSKIQLAGDQATGVPRNYEGLANEKAKKLGREKMIGAGQYGTIVVSARSDRYPVPLYMHYLPPYFYQGDLAAETAAKALSTDKVTLDRIYFVEWKRAMYTEYSANGQKVLVHSFQLVVEPHEKVLRGKGILTDPDPKAMSRIDQEWAKIKQEVE
jgi:hypothetical protein